MSIDHFAAWPTLPFVVIDFETTGVDPEKDRVVEVGLARFEGGEHVGSRVSLIDPGVPIPAAASAIHGITDDDVKGKPQFRRFVCDQSTIDMLLGAVPVAYNADFDRRFFLAELDRSVDVKECIPAVAWPAWVDPLVYIRDADKYVRGKGRHKLEVTCKRHGILIENAHSAKGDAEATGRLWLKLTKDMQNTHPRISDTTVSGYIRRQSRVAERQNREFQEWQGRQSNG